MTKDVYSEAKQRNDHRKYYFMIMFALCLLLMMFGAILYNTGFNEDIGGGRTSDKKTATVIDYKICEQKDAEDIQIKVSYVPNSLLNITNECYINQCFSSKYVYNNYHLGDPVTISVDNDADIKCMSINQASSIAINGFILLLTSAVCFIMTAVIIYRCEKEDDFRNNPDKIISSQSCVKQQCSNV
jgi:hypothetical protein